MSILDKLERKMPWLSFRNLYLYMVAIFLLGLAINIMNRFFYDFYLCLNPELIIKGQVWRLFTYVFYPPSSSGSIILSLLMIFVYYSITKTLTMMWGNFKFNFYILIGYLSQILAAFIIYFIFKQNIIFYPVYTTFSIIMAFALSFPDAYFMIYFFIPLKAKYFAYMEIAIYIINFIFSSTATRIAILCSAINVFVFFVLLKGAKNEKSY